MIITNNKENIINFLQSLRSIRYDHKEKVTIGTIILVILKQKYRGEIICKHNLLNIAYGPIQKKAHKFGLYNKRYLLKNIIEMIEYFARLPPESSFI